MSTVRDFQLGFSNTGHPYALAKLSCGHLASVVLVPRRGACWTCKAEMDLAESGTNTCVCGSISFVISNRRNPHLESDRATKIGDVIECENCASEAKQLEWLKALDPSEVHHARMRYGSYHFYRHDTSSPSGFFLIGSVTPTPAVEALLAARRVSPLSPTEMA